MKNKGFIKVMLLSASLVTLCSNVFAQSDEVIASAVDEESNIKGEIFVNVHKLTQKSSIGFRATLLTTGEKFKNAARSSRRIDVSRVFNGVPVLKTDATLNANLTKAISTDILKWTDAQGINKMVVSINPYIITREGEVVKRKARFSFDVPSLSNKTLNVFNNGANKSPFVNVQVEFSDPNAVYDPSKKIIIVSAMVKSTFDYAPWYLRNLVTQCERSTPLGTTRDCNAYVKDLLAADPLAKCSVMGTFALRENGVIRTSNLAPKGGYVSPTSAKIVHLVASSKSAPLCSDGQKRKAEFIIQADQFGRGKSDTAGILPKDYFDAEGKIIYELVTAARITDSSEFYSHINREAFGEGPSVFTTFTRPAEINAE